MFESEVESIQILYSPLRNIEIIVKRCDGVVESIKNVHDAILGERWISGYVTGLETNSQRRTVFNTKEASMITTDSFNKVLAIIEDLYSMSIEEYSLGLLNYVNE